ncbi:MAG: flagellar basal body rod protein FlgC [Oscillospiraceae bacterium]
MSFFNSLNIAGSALTATRLRMDVITQNLANATTTMTDEGTPYKRKQVIYQDNPLDFKASLKEATVKSAGGGGVKVTEIVESNEPFKPIYNPSHPHANEDGYVFLPNVNTAEEQVDLMAATRAYEANITSLTVVKAMTMRALEIGK